MNLSKEEKKIVKEILQIENSYNITVESLFCQIIKGLENEIKYKVEDNRYIFEDEKSIKYLEIIIYTLKKLINDNLLFTSELSIINKEKISITFFYKGKELNNFLILELKSILNRYIYITPDLKDLFKYNSLKVSLMFLYSGYILGAPLGIYLLWNLVLKTIGLEIHILLFLILEMIFLGILIYKNFKALIKFFKYPYLNDNAFNTELAFWSFLITFLSFLISILSFLHL